MKRTITWIVPALTALLTLAPWSAAQEVAVPDTIVIIDFETETSPDWNVINDGVMGGLSRSSIRRSDQGSGIFSGSISLENNGGFASVRRAVDIHDMSAHQGLEVRVRGDGRTYQLRLRTTDRYDGISYRAMFETRDGHWTSTRIPFTAFRPVFRGRIIADAPPLDTTSIRQLAFLLADKEPGPFHLEIDVVRCW